MSRNEARQESPYVRLARRAYGLAQQTVPRWSHPKSPHHATFPQLVACVVLKTALRMTYRAFVEGLRATDRVRAVLGLERIPRYSTLNRAMGRVRSEDLQRLLEVWHRHLGTQEAGVADGAAVEPSQSPNYCGVGGGWSGEAGPSWRQRARRGRPGSSRLGAGACTGGGGRVRPSGRRSGAGGEMPSRIVAAGASIGRFSGWVGSLHDGTGSNAGAWVGPRSISRCPISFSTIGVRP